MKLYESAEDYLESVLILEERLGTVRSIDVANALGVSKPSVSVAMKKLRENGYVAMEADGAIKLLPQGRQVARRVYERHQLLTRFFTALGVPEAVAAADACKAEHALSQETFDRLKAHALDWMAGSRSPVTRIAGRSSPSSWRNSAIASKPV